MPHELTKNQKNHLSEKSSSLILCNTALFLNQIVACNKWIVEEVGGMFKREGHKYTCGRFIIDVWQEATQYCKAIIFQLKINIFFLKVDCI